MGWGDRWGTNDDLQAVIDAWSNLPEAVKQDIVTVARQRPCKQPDGSLLAYDARTGCFQED